MQYMSFSSSLFCLTVNFSCIHFPTYVNLILIYSYIKLHCVLYMYHSFFRQAVLPLTAQAGRISDPPVSTSLALGELQYTLPLPSDGDGSLGRAQSSAPWRGPCL